jgi:hypothetical protein
MPTELERAAQIDADIKAADERRKVDAEESAMAGEKLDKMLACLDAMGKRLDAYEAKGKEGDGDEPEEKGDPKELASDSREDSRMRNDSAALDAEEIAHFKAQTGAAYEVKADSVLAHIQSDADRVATSWGKDAPHPWTGEAIASYRRRCARPHQQYSENWKNVDLSTLSGQPLRNATREIFADSIAASSSSESYPETMREVRRRDPDTGHLIKEYYGSPMVWMSQFMPARRSAKFNLDRRRDDR